MGFSISGLGSIICLALLGTQPPVEPPALKITVEGTVADYSTGLPIERALVRLEQESVFTGPDGRFTLKSQTIRRYKAIEAVRPGYERVRDGVMADRPLQTLTLRLKRFAEITGKVRNEDGEPVQGLRVQAYRRYVATGSARLSQSSFSTTDDLGRFRLAELPAGEYLVRLMGRTGSMAYIGETRRSAPESRDAFTPQYFPGVADQSAAQVVKLEPGQAWQMEFTTLMRKAVTVRGRIANHAGYHPVTLELGRPDELPMGNRTHINIADGRFEIFDVTAGKYQITAQRTVNHEEERGLVAIQVGSTPVDGVQLTLYRPAHIEVKVQGVEPELAQAPVIDLSLTSREQSGQGDYDTTARRGDAGTLRLDGVWPGKYKVKAHSNAGELYIASVTCGGVDLLHEELTVVEGIVPAPIEVRLAPGAAQLEVAVLHDGKPAPSAQVLLLGDGGQTTLAQYGGPQSEGKILVGRLAPGSYGVLALPYLAEIEYENPQVLEKYAGRIKRVTVGAGAKESIQVELAQEIRN